MARDGAIGFEIRKGKRIAVGLLPRLRTVFVVVANDRRGLARRGSRD